jgi:hypothetical protein
MSFDRALVAVETMIADHVAVSFHRNSAPPVETTASLIRSRITDHFGFMKPGAEQDNCPPAFLELRHRITEIFGPVCEEPISHERAEAIKGLQRSLALFRGVNSRSASNEFGNPLHMKLLLERQQLALKNEFTEGFGRVEIWLISIAALGLVLINAIEFVWALPILALGIGRSWFLDRRCRKRHGRIAEIDALIGMDSSPHD